MGNQKINCWELKQCGLESAGKNVGERGICPAAVGSRFTGINNGENAGRYCWRVTGTLCDCNVQGLFAEKALSCCKCDLFLLVVDEEGSNLTL